MLTDINASYEEMLSLEGCEMEILGVTRACNALLLVLVSGHYHWMEYFPNDCPQG